MSPKPKTISDALYRSYANLAMAHAAVEEGATRYEKKHFIIRARVRAGLTTGTMHVGPFADEDRLKLILPKACCYCGSGDKLSLDHLVSRKLGGSDSGDNLVWACRSCNSSKGARDLLEWMESREEFPPILLLRRYLKLAFGWCEANGVLNVPLADVGDLDIPFAVDLLPHRFPPPGELRLWSVPMPDACEGR